MKNSKVIDFIEKKLNIEVEKVLEIKEREDYLIVDFVDEDNMINNLTVYKKVNGYRIGSHGIEGEYK